MARTLTEDERKFIADQYQNKGKVGQAIIEAFKAKFDWVPSASVINKYQNYKPEGAEEVEEVEEDTDGLKVLTKDSRKIKGIFDFSEGDVPDDVFAKIVKLTGKSESKTWRILRTARKKGYKKIDLETGKLSK